MPDERPVKHDDHTHHTVRSAADVELGALLFGPRQDVGARLPAQRVELLTLCLRRRAEARAWQTEREGGRSDRLRGERAVGRRQGKTYRPWKGPVRRPRRR